jgi:hypothetical protein
MAVGSSPRSAVSRCRWSGCFEERVHPAGHKVARRVAASVDEQEEKQVEVHLIEAVPIHIGGDKRGGEVVPWMCLFLFPDAVGIVEHLDDGGYPRALGQARGIGVERLG